MTGGWTALEWRASFVCRDDGSTEEHAGPAAVYSPAMTSALFGRGLLVHAGQDDDANATDASTEERWQRMMMARWTALHSAGTSSPGHSHHQQLPLPSELSSARWKLWKAGQPARIIAPFFLATAISIRLNTTGKAGQAPSPKQLY